MHYVHCDYLGFVANRYSNRSRKSLRNRQRPCAGTALKPIAVDVSRHFHAAHIGRASMVQFALVHARGPRKRLEDWMVHTISRGLISPRFRLPG